MFCVARNIIQIAQRTCRRNVRLYCSGKQNRQSTAIDPDENSTNQEKQSNDQQAEDDYDSDDEERNQSDSYAENKLMHRGDFTHIIRKDRETFISMVRIFIDKDIHRRNHVEFIYAAMKQMKEFGVERDLSCYKELLEVMPKGKFIATNMFQAEFMHYPKQQNCIMDLLGEMEYNGEHKMSIHAGGHSNS